MGIDKTDHPGPRQRVLLVTHCFDANYSMESRLSWMRAIQAAQRHEVTLICAEPYFDVHCDIHAQIPSLKIVTVAHTPLEKLLIQSPIGFYLAYRLWHWRVAQLAKKMHHRKPFALVHQVSYCGYREPGYCWQLRAPFVWGPIGGTQNVPWRFLSQFDVLGALKECARSLANLTQLHLGRRVAKALRTAKAAYAANRQVQASFAQSHRVHLPCQLETGLDQIREQHPSLRDSNRPLRVLWAGRLESWKALPLLLRAVAKLPQDVSIEVRVLGSGTRKSRWQRLASQLGIAELIQWVPLPSYSERDEHYAWADVLAFTSLRDTSGTGLLEALAAGVPIIGLDHQGAKDIMSLDCAVAIPVSSPRQVVSDMRAALQQLANDPQELLRLSIGAQHRAKLFHWDRLGEEMLARYDEVMGDTCQIPVENAKQSGPISGSEPALPLNQRVTV